MFKKRCIFIDTNKDINDNNNYIDTVGKESNSDNNGDNIIVSNIKKN